jgi:hypothetical protein
LAAAVFLVLLTFIGGGNAGSNIVTVAIMFVFLLVFGWVFDSWFYRLRLRRWEKKRSGGA